MNVSMNLLKRGKPFATGTHHSPIASRRHNKKRWKAKQLCKMENPTVNSGVSPGSC